MSLKWSIKHSKIKSEEHFIILFLKLIMRTRLDFKVRESNDSISYPNLIKKQSCIKGRLNLSIINDNKVSIGKMSLIE